MSHRYETLQWLPGPYFFGRQDMGSANAENARLTVIRDHFCLQPSFHHFLDPEEQKPEYFLRYPLASVALKGHEFVFESNQERIDFWEEFLRDFWRRPSKVIIANHFPHWTGGGDEMVPHLAAVAYNVCHGPLKQGATREVDARDLGFHWLGNEEIRSYKGFRDVKANHCMAWGPLLPASIAEDYRNAARFLSYGQNYTRLLFTCLPGLDQMFDSLQVSPTKVDYLLNFKPQDPASHREFMEQRKKAAYGDRKKVEL